MKAVTITQIDPSELEELIDSSVKKAITSQSTISNDEMSGGLWLNLSELCDYHPNKPSPQTVYGWVSNQKIPHYKGHDNSQTNSSQAKGNLRFYKPEIDEWLRQGRRKTTKEIEEETTSFLASKKNQSKG